MREPLQVPAKSYWVGQGNVRVVHMAPAWVVAVQLVRQVERHGVAHPRRKAVRGETTASCPTSNGAVGNPESLCQDRPESVEVSMVRPHGVVAVPPGTN